MNRPARRGAVDQARERLGTASGTSVPGPDAPLQYTRRARYADRRAAVCDARAGEPCLYQVPVDATVSTATVRARAGEFQARCAGELSAMLNDTRAARIRAATLMENVIPALERRLREAAQRLAGIPAELSAEELGRRHAGDENASEQLVADRNSAVHAKLRATAAAEVRRFEEELDQARAELGRLREETLACQDAMVGQWARLYALAAQRIAQYQHHLARHHPDGQWLPDMAPAALQAALRELRTLLDQRTADLFAFPGGRIQPAAQQSTTPARALRPGSPRRSAS